MSKLIQGRIVYLKDKRPDPQGYNPKSRGFVIISSNKEIADGEPYWAVAITSTIRSDSEEGALNWSKDKNGLTKLDRRSVAKACWQEWLFDNDIENLSGLVEPKFVEQIRIKAEECRTEPPDPLEFC
ncbi:MAG: hypothetical protein WKF77_06460 [Planctomycetaceae bacterium]